MLCYVMLCYVMLCYVMLCYVMLCYVMLCMYVCMYVCNCMYPLVTTAISNTLEPFQHLFVQRERLSVGPNF